MSPTAQDAFRPIPGLIRCAGVTGRWGLLCHAQNAVRLLALSMHTTLALYSLLVAFCKCTLAMKTTLSVKASLV